MNSRTKYTAADHKRAYELYRTLGSFSAVSREEGMPTVGTVWQWASAGYKCPFNCQWHDWEKLETRIQNALRARVKEEDVAGDQKDQKILKGLEHYIQSDINKLKVNRALEAVVLKKLQEGLLEGPETISEGQSLLYKTWSQDRLIMGEPTDRSAVDLNLGGTQIDIDKILEALEPDERKSILRTIRRLISDKGDA